MVYTKEFEAPVVEHAVGTELAMTPTALLRVSDELHVEGATHVHDIVNEVPARKDDRAGGAVIVMLGSVQAEKR